ncbi:serine threonine protein phosphatase 2A 55 kDa regulatory subunit [Musa troglodytarum]|uniref:Serine threonine protein phosphatase 2A 55 kDa regulatory subunit n=1 Tax=Musa troglodytarum TaxID=320322 RepID=A0A9E7KZ33_9LILI|nr:serine threonine protein phosphatase 2A 55 kDa regulatory subunit [Musa troglodytarum]URE38937.1 serine threonine protein phosphatase 2A 55 kDa regulatory subunit [Musa troglodytarum]
MLFGSASLCKFILVVAYNLLVASNVLFRYLTRNLLMTVWLLQLSELYNGDFIFDKFDCCLSRDGRHFATGTYSNTFKVFCHDGGHTDGTRLEASKNPNRRESMIVLNKLFFFNHLASLSLSQAMRIQGLIVATVTWIQN